MPAKLERCIKKVMASKSFAKTYKERKDKKMTRKSLAWAICRKSLNV